MKGESVEHSRPGKQILVVAAGIGVAAVAGAGIYEVISHRHLAARNHIFDITSDPSDLLHVKMMAVFGALFAQQCCMFEELQRSMFDQSVAFEDAYRSTNKILNKLTHGSLGKYALVNEVVAGKCDNEFCDLTKAHYSVTPGAMEAYRSGLFGPELVPRV